MVRRRVAFWRPYQGKGSAAIIEFNDEKNTVWLTFIPESTGEKKFDNTKKTVAKLGVQDIGSMIAVLTGRIEGLGEKKDKYWSGLMHKIKNSNDSSVITLNVTEKGYGLGLSVKRGENAAVRMSVGLSPGDGEVLRVFLETTLLSLLQDEQQQPERTEQEPETAQVQA